PPCYAEHRLLTAQSRARIRITVDVWRVCVVSLLFLKVANFVVSRHMTRTNSKHSGTLQRSKCLVWAGQALPWRVCCKILGSATSVSGIRTGLSLAMLAPGCVKQILGPYVRWQRPPC